MTKKWYLTSVLLATYTLVFEAWVGMSRPWIRVTDLLATLVLGGALIVAARRSYFANGWDLALHATVVLDLWIEGWFIPIHDGRGFYFCALGFAVVIIGYREWALRCATVARP